jgi:WD40 repeat protein
MLPSFSFDFLRVLSLERSGKVCFWDANTGETIKEIGTADHSYAVNATLSHDGRLVALADSNTRVRVYRVVDNKELWSRSTDAKLLALSPDSRFLVTHARAIGTGGYWKISVFDASNGRHLFDTNEFRGPFSSFAFGLDGLLYCSDSQGVIRAWNVEAKREQWSFSTLN